MRLPHLTLQATFGRRCFTGAIIKVAAGTSQSRSRCTSCPSWFSSEPSMVDATMRGGDLSPQKLLLRLTSSGLAPSAACSCRKRATASRGSTLSQAVLLGGCRLGGRRFCEAGALPPSVLCLSAKRFLPSYPKCQELRVQLQVECRVYSTQHLAPKATSCPHKDPGAL